MSKGARRRLNRQLLRDGALILPHEEARIAALPPPPETEADRIWKERERRIDAALARVEESEKRTLAWIGGRS